jgi:hypothetical protein
MHITTTDILGRFEVRHTFELPDFKGSRLRGLLHGAIVRTACLSEDPGACGIADDPKGRCPRPAECPVGQLLSPPQPQDAEAQPFSGRDRLPAPLVPLFPDGWRFARGATFTLGARLVGDAGAALERTVRTALAAVPALPVGDAPDCLALSEVAVRPAVAHTLAPDPDAFGTLTLETASPLSLRRENRQVLEPSFQDLFRFVHRRLVALAAAHGTLDPDHEATFARLDDFALGVRLVRSTLGLREWERQPTDGQPHPIYGMIGTITYEGAIGRYLPYLEAAAALRVGTGISFGMGLLRPTFVPA